MWRAALGGADARALPGRGSDHPCCPLGDPAERELDVREGVGVREAQVLLARAAERRPGEHRDTRLVQEAIRHLCAVPEAKAGDVREHVEGALRQQARDAGDRVQPGDDRIAPLSERAHHRVDLGRARRQRGDAGTLHERRGARHRVRHQLRHRVHERAGEHAEAEPPAGHRVHLAEAVEQDRSLIHRVLGEQRAVLALVERLAVDLVAEDPEIPLARDARDLADRRAREDRARRVVRAVHDDRLRPRRDERAQLVEVWVESVPFAERKGHTARPGELDHRGVDGEARIGIDGLVALLEQREERVEHDRLRTGRDDDLPRIDAQSAVLAEPPRDGLAQLDHPRGGRVVRLAALERGDARRDDRRRRVEVRLADLGVDDLAALRLELARYVRELERMGFDHLVIYDHVLGAHPDRPGGWTGPYTHESLFHEPFVLFGYFAAVTTRLELATAVIILPQRQTALVAKQAAEVDVLTNGRFRLGVGIGWNPLEFDALGEDFHTRGRRMEEQIALLRTLWTDRVVDFQGKWHRVDRAGLHPLPVQRPIPIWMGGGYKSNVSPTERASGIVEPALRRIAKLADGWFTHVQPGDEGAAGIARFRELVRETGRDPKRVGLEGRVNAFRVAPEEWPREIEWWRRMDATHVEMNTMNAKFGSLDEHLAALGRFAGMVRAG